ncbi:MAG: hypothetical protein F6K22_29275 [Okeania sp. SIO2F4]|nr:hypothetical protein [Okeania sp. SIO2F4]NES06549.1 hypothetical protein [Okeania sp. SIO2F4]
MSSQILEWIEKQRSQIFKIGVILNRQIKRCFFNCLTASGKIIDKNY